MPTVMELPTAETFSCHRLFPVDDSLAKAINAENKKADDNLKRKATIDTFIVHHSLSAISVVMCDAIKPPAGAFPHRCSECRRT